MKEKVKKILRKLAQFALNPRLLLCFGIAWIITNGWSYVLLGLGTWLEINWMIAVSMTYIGFLWFPMTPEKIVTFAIAIWLLRLLFPNDEKTLGVLKQTYADLKRAFRLKKEQRKKNKQTSSEVEGSDSL